MNINDLEVIIVTKERLMKTIMLEVSNLSGKLLVKSDALFTDLLLFCCGVDFVDIKYSLYKSGTELESAVASYVVNSKNEFILKYQVKGEVATSSMFNKNPESTLERTLYDPYSNFTSPFCIKATKFPVLLEFLEKFTITENSETFKTILEYKKSHDEIFKLCCNQLKFKKDKELDLDILISKLKEYDTIKN